MNQDNQHNPQDQNEYQSKETKRDSGRPKKPCIAIETQGKNPQTYWFPSITDLALAYNVYTTVVIRSIEDGRPINSYGVYVDEAE